MKNVEKRQSEINRETYKTNETIPKTKDEKYTWVIPETNEAKTETQTTTTLAKVRANRTYIEYANEHNMCKKGHKTKETN